MKTTTLLATAMVAMALTSCADDEPVSINRGDAISFRPAMGSRATEVTNANLQSFYVTSFMGTTPYIDNVAYTKGGDGFYNSAVPYYWPGDDTPLDFYAYSPSLQELYPDGDPTTDGSGDGVVFNATEKQLVNFSVADSIKNQVDFITAYGTGKKSVNEEAGLELTFGHRLSQIEIQAKSSSDQFTFKVAGVRIGRAQYLATFDFTTNTWTLDDWHDTQVYTSRCPEVTLGADPVSIMGPEGNAMLLPQTLTPWDPTGDPDNVAREAYLSVYVQIITNANGTTVYPFPSDNRTDEVTGQKRQYAWATIPLSGTWEAGKKYVYTLDFSHGAGFTDPDDPIPGKPVLGDPIKFTVNVEPWQLTSPDVIPMTVK